MKRPLRSMPKPNRHGWLRSPRGNRARSARRTQLLIESFEPRIVLAGTPQLIDINPSGASDPSDFAQVGNLTYFAADDGLHGRELWRSDGTPDGTQSVRDIQPGSGSSNPSGLVALDGVIYFVADDGVSGRELWRSDGTEAGTVMVRDINPGEGYQYPYGDGPFNSVPQGMIVLDDRLVFGAEESTTGGELWSSDGTSAGTALVKDISTGTQSTYYGDYPNASFPANLVNVNGTLFFTADDGEHGRELWKSDGTANGTVMVKDIFEGSYPYYDDGYYYGSYNYSSRPAHLTAVGGTLFFAATDGVSGVELWKSDGTDSGTVQVKDIDLGASDSLLGANSFTEFNGRLMFAAEDAEHGRELWTSDGTDAGTTRVMDIQSGPNDGITNGFFTNVNGTLFFAADNGSDGVELWRTDGTESGTAMVLNLDDAASSSYPQYLTEANGRLYFSATTPDLGSELWESDGTGAGTAPVANLSGDDVGSSPLNLFSAGQNLFFTADDGVNERELFVVSAGVTSRTARLSVYVDGQEIALPSKIGVAGDGTPLSQVQTLGDDGILSIAPIADEPLESVTVGDFFTTWRTSAGDAGNNSSATFSDNELMGNSADAENTVQMFVNGRVSTDFEDHVIRDGDEIILVFGFNPIVSINTNFGGIVIELFESDTPGTVDNFLNYINDGDYVNSFFHRSDPGFVIQGGGFATTDTIFTGVGQFFGIPTDPQILNEPGISNLRGTIAMAKLGGDPNSATSQFFVNLGDNSELDRPENDSFTVFGHVLDMTTVDTIASLPINNSNAAPFRELPVSENGELAVVSDVEGNGQVSGIKFLDINTNGTFDDGETLLPGVTVYADRNENGQFDAGEISTQTDAEGRYRLELKAGTHLIGAELTDGRVPTVPSDGLGLHVTVEIGRLNENVDFGEVTLEAPSLVTLLAVSDTGDLDDDGLTRFNNHSAESTLQFLVSNVLGNSEVRLYRDGVLIGSAVTVDGAATVVTDGESIIADGVHNITATQVVSNRESQASTALILTVDSEAPEVLADAAAAIAPFGVLYAFQARVAGGEPATFALQDAPDGMTIDPQSGEVRWTPTLAQAMPHTIEIQAMDPAGNVGQQTIDLTVVGEIPALPETYALDEDGSLLIDSAGGVLANDGNNDSVSLTASVITDPANGTIALSQNGAFLYTPNPNFFGTDSFTYQATDGEKSTNIARVTFEVRPLNDAPEATEDDYTTAEDTPLVIEVAEGVLANDQDVDGDPLSVELADPANNGTVTLDADGSFAYTPNANFFGTDTFSYRLTDGNETSDPIPVTIVVTAVDDALQAVADSYAIDEDSVRIVGPADGVLANDDDPDEDATVTIQQNPTNGTVTLNADGSFTYTPDADFTGDDSFTYRLSDGVNESIASVSITVVGQPDAPTANDDSVNVANGATDHTLDVLANDTTAPDLNDNLMIVSVTQGSQSGTVTLQEGDIVYRPANGFVGTETFDYTIEDSDGLQSTATVTVTVAESNQNSISGFVYVDTNHNGKRDVGEMGIPGALMTLTGATDLGDAVSLTTLTTNNGLYRFENLSPGTYQIIQRQPTSLVDGEEDSSQPGADLSANDKISALIVSGGQEFTDNNFGEARLRAGSISIAWFFASATSTSAVFREAIAAGEESIGDFQLAEAIRNDAIAPPDVVNRAPVAAADSYRIDAGTSLATTDSNGVLANDADPDGDILSATLITDVTQGSLAFNSDGTFIYTPDVGFSGIDTFSYQVDDGFLTSNLATVTITVDEQPNSFNVDENSPAGLTIGRVVLGDGETLSYSIVDPSTPDDLLLRPDDHVSGDPASPFVLIEYLDFQCPTCKAIHPLVKNLEDDFDGELLVVRRHLPLTSVHPNAFAAAVAAEAAGRQGSFEVMADLLFENQDEWAGVTDPRTLFEDYADELNLDVNAFLNDLNDTALADRVQRDLDAADRLGANATPTLFLNGDPVDVSDALDDFEEIVDDALDDFDDAFVINRSTGDLIVANGSRLNFESAPTFNLTIAGTNVNGDSVTTTVTIQINNVNESAPIAFADTYNLTQNTTLTIDAAAGLLSNDTDSDGDSLTAVAITNPSNGTLTLNDDGSFTYVPDTGFSGNDSFSYQASDGDFTSNIATVTLDIDGDNSSPSATDDTYATDEDTPLSVDIASGVLANDSDPQGDPLTTVLVDSTANGDLQLNNDGSFVYTPDAGFSGVDSFTYRAGDGSLSSDVATVTITVNAVNDLPIANNDEFVVTEGDALNVDGPAGVLANDSDSDGDSIVAVLVSSTTNGTLTLEPDGSFDYTPNASFTGVDAFTYEVSDGIGTSNTATVQIRVNPTNTFSLFEASAAGTLVGQLRPLNPDLDGDVIYQIANDQLDDRLRLVPDDHLSGTPTSSVVLIEYLDFQCPTCKAFHSVVDQLEDDFAGELLVVRRHFPLINIHANALTAALAAEAAGRQDRFDAMSDLLFANQSEWASLTNPLPQFESYAADLLLDVSQFQADMIDPVLADRVQRDADAAGQLGAAGTPSFFLNGSMIAQLPTTQGEFNQLIQDQVDQVDDAFRLNRFTGQLLVRDAEALDFETSPHWTIDVRATDLDGDTEIIHAAIDLIDVGENVPRAVNDAYTLDEDSVLVTDAVSGLIANDVDDDGDVLFPHIEVSPMHGSLVLALDGSFTYTPDEDFHGTDTFVYQLSDGRFFSDMATVTLDVTSVNDVPVAADDAYSTNTNNVLSVPASAGVLINDSDRDGDSFIAKIVAQPDHGSVLLAADGTFQYTPDNDYTGPDAFTYRVDDGFEESPPANVSITVHPTNTFDVAEHSAPATEVGFVQSQSIEVDEPAIFEFVRSGVDTQLSLLPDDHISGDPAAPVVLIEYLDFQCPTCRSFHPVVEQLEDDFAGELLVVRRHFPLTQIHANAFAAGVAAEAAGRQGQFEEMADQLFDNQNEWSGAADPRLLFESYATALQLDLDQFRTDSTDASISERVQRDYDDAIDLGAGGTPTFYLQGEPLLQLPNSTADFSNQIQAAVDQVDQVFSLDRTNGLLTVRDPNALDADASPTLTVDVRITDEHGDTEVVTVTVHVSDVVGTAAGSVLAASLIDEAMGDEEAWLLPI